MLHCSNTDCQAANPLDGKFCHHCRTPLVKRYLWGVGEGIEAYPKGKLASDRYLVINSPIILDTKPALTPQILDEEIPPAIVTYLKLFPYRPHIPQVYGQLARSQDNETSGHWLLEYGSFPQAFSQSIGSGQLFPSLTAAWSKASPLRQLNWLWQMAQLWQPLFNQEAASSLLDPQRLKVNGPLFLLQELERDRTEEGPAALAQLGSLWSQWTAVAAPEIQPFFQKLCAQLRSGQIDRAEVLVALLEDGLGQCGQKANCHYQIYARSDAGPSRARNEDACYPPSGTRLQASRNDSPLAIICDGVGGHEGGEIASGIAIDRVRDKLAPLQGSTSASPLSLVETIEEAVCEANDAIGDRNDSENRHERQRMGTTLILTLARAHQMYLAHVGDSRIYLISSSGCYQMTLDDDWASWEVRLGYTCYRAAVKHVNAGALLQALGMSASSRLRPTVNRFILDEDCVFLLCSDGLSDFERVEQYWETEILPVLAGEQSVEEGVERLVEIANRHNGHDNVTVTLVRCQVRPAKSEGKVRPIALPQPRKVAVSNPTVQPPDQRASPLATQQPTAQTPAPSRRSGLRFALACGILVLLGLGLGGLSYLVFPEVRSRLQTLVGRPDVPPVLPPTTAESPLLQWAVGDIIQLEEALDLATQPSLSAPDNPNPPLPATTRLKVARQQIDSEENLWLQFQVCPPVSSPASASPSPESQPPSTVGGGWAQADNTAIASATRLTEASADTCPLPVPSPTPTSTTSTPPIQQATPTPTPSPLPTPAPPPQGSDPPLE